MSNMKWNRVVIIDTHNISLLLWMYKKVWCSRFPFTRCEEVHMSKWGTLDIRCKTFTESDKEPPTQRHTHTHTEDKFYRFFKLKVHYKLSLVVMRWQSIFRNSEQIHAFSTFGLVTIFLSSEITYFYWFEALPTGTWDNDKKLESIDNKSLGPINISDQSRVDVREWCWGFALSILSKKRCLSHNHFPSQETFMDLSKTWCAMCWWRATWDIVSLSCFLNIHFADYLTSNIQCQECWIVWIYQLSGTLGIFLLSKYVYVEIPTSRFK